MSSEKLIQEIRELKELMQLHLLCTKPYLTLEEAAKYLGLSKSYMYKLNISENRIPFSKPNDKIIYYKRSDLDKWVQKNNCHSPEYAVRVKPRKRRSSLE